MTIAIVAMIAVGSYAAGIFTMCLVDFRRSRLVEPIGVDLVPPRPPMAPPMRPIEPQRTSPFAPRPKPPAPPAKPARRRQIHWPIARGEPAKPLTDDISRGARRNRIEASEEPSEPKPTIATSIALPDIEFGQ